MKTAPASQLPVYVFLAVMLGFAFSIYVTFRQNYIGATDWYGYYQEAQLMKAGRIDLPMELPTTDFPAAVPMGYFPVGERAIPQYPPGYPALLALAGFVHGEFFVTPVIGVLSCLVLFLLIRDLTQDPWVAAVFATLWAFCPIVAFGSTNVMSDLIAATGVLGAYYLYRHQHLAWSALVLGLSISVRPTNVLFLAPFAILLFRDRRVIRYGCWLAIPAALYACYNHQVFGAPWRTGYSDISYDLVASVVPSHLPFYLWQTVLVVSPVLILLLIPALRRLDSEKIFYVAWFAVYLAFYCFWRSGGDRWWWTRFLLPGYVPLFLLSAFGFVRLRAWVESRHAGWRGFSPGVLLLGLLALLPLYYVYFGQTQGDLWVRNKGIEYFSVVRTVDGFAPPGSYVGSVEFGGATRLYSKNFSFLSVHSNSPQLVRHAQAQGRRTFLIVERWNADNSTVQELLRDFRPTRLPDIMVWGGLAFYELHAPAP